MDFLDQKFASVNRAEYSEFLGIGSKGAKISGQTVAEESLLSRYPFSADCETQKRNVQALLAESAEMLNRRNNAKKGKSRDNMTGWLRAFDAYIPAAIEFMNTVSCTVKTPPEPLTTPAPITTPAVPVTPVSNDAVLNTAVVSGDNSNLANAGAQASSILKTPMSNTLKYSLIGLGALIVVVVGISIVKRN